jgi:hypothetical protein
MTDSLMWEKAEYEAEVTKLQAISRALLIQDGEHMAIAFLFATHDPVRGVDAKHVLPVGAAQFATDEHKDAFSQVLRSLAIQTKAIAIVFITEIWMLEKKEGPLDTSIRPSESPDRVEALMLSSEHVRLGHRLFYARITRDPEGKPIVADWESPSEPAMRVAGRFVHLLPPVN